MRIWYSERIDDEDGGIRYEVHGPKDSFVTFEGPNAKADCEHFMAVVASIPAASPAPEVSDEELVETSDMELAKELFQYGICGFHTLKALRGLGYDIVRRRG